jgi:gamma-glutamyltranspeptidase/glutathione hydrolase
MGGQYQAAGHAYVLSQMIDFGLNPQDALNYPRIFPTNGFLDVESDFDKEVVNELSLRGHKINDTNQVIGGGQMIMIDNDRKVLVGASDWRKDGFAIGY